MTAKLMRSNSHSDWQGLLLRTAISASITVSRDMFHVPRTPQISATIGIDHMSESNRYRRSFFFLSLTSSRAWTGRCPHQVGHRCWRRCGIPDEGKIVILSDLLLFLRLASLARAWNWRLRRLGQAFCCTNILQSLPTEVVSPLSDYSTATSMALELPSWMIPYQTKEATLWHLSH